jgi:small subunit ribosomal protein S3
MGQKVNPRAFRLGSLYDWDSQWYADSGNYQKFLLQDIKLRDLLEEQLDRAGLVKTEIERSMKKIRVVLYVSRPGVVIGRGGSGLKALKKLISKELDIDTEKNLKIDVKEVKNPDLSAKLIAKEMAGRLIGRYPHRRAVRKAIDKVMGAGAKGIKIQLSGRIGGSEIGRTEKYSEGTVPLQTLRADIDYAQVPALTKWGYVGVKVWIYKEEKEI